MANTIVTVRNIPGIKNNNFIFLLVIKDVKKYEIKVEMRSNNKIGHKFSIKIPPFKSSMCDIHYISEM
jgi:hypothetical protein